MARVATALLAPISVAAARIRRRPQRGLLAALGIAAATAMLAATIVGGRVSSELSVQRALAAVPVDQRAMRVLWSGAPAGGYRAVDPPATRALAQLAPGPAVRTVLYRETRFENSRIAVVTGVNDIASWVTLTSGRLPRSCTPSRCEVVQVAGAPMPVAAAGPTRLVRVGTGRLTSALPFGSLTDLGVSAGHHTPPATLVSGNVEQVSQLPGLAPIYRTYSWTRPIDPHRVHSWDVGSLLGREARALTGLSSGFSQWSISAPDQALIDATDRSDTAGARLTLVGGEVATLLLAFVVLAANALRGDAVAERRRLERRGARRGQVWLFALAEGGWIALLGVLAGALAGIVIGVAVCNSAGLPPGAVMSHSLLTGQALLLGLAALVVSVLLVVVVLLLPDGPTRYGGVLADAVAVAGLAALALAAARGATSIGSTTDARSDPLLPLLPLLVALVAGVAVARLLGPAMRLLERRVRGASAAVRIAVVSVAREPLPAAIAAAFLAVALGLGFFATAYGQTLRTGQSDQADFVVPADVTLAEGPQLVRPLDAASLEQYQRLAGGTVAMPVLRLSATAATTGTRPVDITALALPAKDIPDLRWRSDTSNISQATLARRLTPAGDVSMRGPLLDGSGLLRLAVDVTGSPVTTALVLQTDRQSFVSLPMGAARVGHSQLERRLPARLAGSRLVAISIDRTAADSKIAIHQQGEGGAVSGIKGSVLLGPLTLGAAPVTDWSGWIGRGGLVAGGPGAPVRFVITGATHPLLRPVQPSDGRPVPVMVSPDLARAAVGGLVRLTFAGISVPGRVVAVGRRFPTVTGSFAAADETLLATALNADDPGSAVPSEMWLRARNADRVAALNAQVTRPPYDSMTRSSHAGTLATLRSDPLSRGIRLVLEGAAALALLLSLAALLLSVAAAVRDDRVALFDLEAQGVGPPTLRSQLRLRAAIVTAVGLVVAVVIGVVLSTATVGLVQVTASATVPVPPLERHLAWPVVLAGLVGFLLLSALAVALSTRAAFSADLPRRATGEAP
ncbi:MAG TPA: hypothetical protein VLK79_13680 [Gaiellales bacterium]|nr:hypothetical protein [Gaiellales bacterium]